MPRCTEADAHARAKARLGRLLVLLTASALVSALAASLASHAAQSTQLSAAALARVGRAATVDEIAAWDIDVRADFAGLPKGVGGVARGEVIWEAQCTSCHGVFGESNSVFAPLVGGTSEDDIASGRVANLREGAGFAQRTTLMKASQLSTLWDYIRRAMPWNAPKSLSNDDVYAVLAYLLNLGGIVSAEFSLSDRNIAEVQRRLPNRDGMVVYRELWVADGKGDVDHSACMTNCPRELASPVTLPTSAHDTHGNIAEQVRPFGPARGTDTSLAARTANAASPDASSAGALSDGASSAGAARAGASGAGLAPGSSAPDTPALLKAQGCLACHGIDQRLVGPALREIAGRHANRTDRVAYLEEKIAKGGQGVWGAFPMPAQPNVSDADRSTMAQWIADGAR